ncbi:kinesin-like protein KIF14 [Bufo gargarizans]|uniref:kinesin-like protein KIF14 n=1 Tax=Bufo gargarizans TaxID=30331 RepID=UPI001CF1B48A|nr:kinesin-like protein KIF14 [Bufo gargarizans]
MEQPMDFHAFLNSLDREIQFTLTASADRVQFLDTQKMCDIPSPIYDELENKSTIPFTPEAARTVSVCSLTYSMKPLQSSTICEKILEESSDTIPAIAPSEENAPSKFQALSTMVSKTFFPGKWKGTDTNRVKESDKALSSHIGKRSAQKRTLCSDIDTACPVSSKQERSNQGQIDTQKSGKSRLPLLKKYAPLTDEDKLGDTRRSLATEFNCGRSSMGCTPSTQETNVKDFEIVAQQQAPTSGMDKLTVPRYSLPNTSPSSCVVPEANPLPTKKNQAAIGSSGEFGPENAAVTVAVRVRPLNDREISSGHKSVVSVTGQNLFVNHPRSHQKISFQYDFCFSFPQPGDAVHDTQENVYRQVALPLLCRVFQGYNACLFAYGQTGSGKSYTMMGYNTDIGIIPRFCQELFYHINVSDQEEVDYHVEMSYFEIYNEKIHDLLNSPRDTGHKIALKVREHQTYGPYVHGLSTYVVASFTDVQTWLQLGNKQRATAATGMNDKSSRSHSVFTLSVTQTMRELLEGEVHDHTRTSRVNLVDLAGSERCNSAQTSGIRLKEGASINKSLLTLSKVISALAEMSDVHKRSFIPYRESLLTWLLKESLGGNSKTAMIATISPASVNLEESLGTLRYATKARNIINVARVNEDSNASLIRELKSEIEKLKAAQQCVLGVDQAIYEASLQEICSLRERLSSQERQLTETQKSWEEKLNLAKHQKLEEAKELQKAGVCFKVDNTLPNLVNLNEDPQLSEVLVYLIKDGQTKMGKQHPGSDHEIQLAGALIASDHCIINNEHGKVTLIPMPGAETFINGNLVKDSVVLHHGDRVILGGNHYFRFNHPTEVQSSRRTVCLGSAGQERIRDFEFAKNELIDAQKQRIENEIDDARLQAQTEMMQELQAAKALAHLELTEQKKLYENQIKQLEKQLEEEQTRKNSLRRNQKEKTLRNRDYLPPSGSSIQVGEMDVKPYKFIQALEHERECLTKQVEKMQYRVKQSISAEKQEQWTALQLSITLEEANAISKSTNKQTIFSRYDPPALNGEEKTVYIKVSNTNLGISTLWGLEKFEEKLAGMRELYHGLLDSSGDELFYDPADTWEVELGQPSPKRGRSSLSRQTSGLLIGKVHTDTFVPSTIFSAVCKKLVTSEVEILGKEDYSQDLVLQLLTDLYEILSSSNDVIQAYEQLELGDVSIQRHLITISSAFNHMSVSVRLIDGLLGAPDTQAAYPKQDLIAEVKKLGGSVAFLLHGCESDITSMLKKSKKQINQSITIIARLLGQLSITRQPNMSPDEKCGLEQAEFISSSIKECFLSGSENCLLEHIDFLVGEVYSLEGLYEKAWLESHKLAEDVRKCLLPLGQSLKGYLDKCRQFWLQFQSMKCQKQDFTQDLSLHYFYKVIAQHLRNVVMDWKELTAKCMQYMTDGAMDFLTMKQDLDGFFKSASLSAKAFSSLCKETDDHQQDSGLSLVMKEIEAAVPELHSSAGDLLRLIKVLGGVNCLNSGMLLKTNNRQLPGGPRADLGIHMWGRSRDSVRVAVAKWNYEALLRENMNFERKKTL